MRPLSRRLVQKSPRSGGSSSGGLPQQSQNRKGLVVIPTKWLFATTILCALSFYSGLILGMNGCVDDDNDAAVGGRLMEGFSSPDNGGLFPSSVGGWAVGMSRVRKSEFMETFHMGIPVDADSRNNNEVLILYNSKEALPGKPKEASEKAADVIPQLNPQVATENCNTLKIVLTGTRDRHQCMALVGNWEDYHIQKWMRLPDKGGISPTLPFRHVSMSHNEKNRPVRIPDQKTTRMFWNTLQTYFGSLDVTLASLAPLASKVALKNTIVVMVCNLGQSELLMNFVCNARAKGLDTSQILVFAVDRETKELAEGLGLTAFFDKTNFGEFPSDAARRYGDKRFTGMMMAKVYCVQLVNMLGYDVLFQDVDMVWFKNPVDFFLNEADPQFDMYFQDDGARTPRYAPYSPNSGFYFVRHNERTEYFFSVFLRMGDIIQTSGSHQSALNQILSEHVSWRGLRVKVYNRLSSDEFPGGFHYHQLSGMWMRDFFAGKKDPYIFHMSWTENKNNKLLFFKQLGEWYLKEQCIGKTAEEIMFASAEATNLEAACCSSEPLFSCHYRDKPSKHPCKNSPPIDKGRKSFW